MGLSISTPQKVFKKVEKAYTEASLDPSLNNLLAIVHATRIGPPRAEPKRSGLQ
ncbi:hypothetical protein BU23DRAFT_558750 [Bimuria novae-zelandiae CBS 107.79]|uniref:Uncharacterized protein n=1 Tax=Bimuria novae-zelandiae CBS 107.79 TaxID=1447943 RepID=A0A6A5UU31_9PLEO|nr:hypothetical protein BU23DRAFT_558750 [Bimuria novae-zelandiae CBS 107.79]